MSHAPLRVTVRGENVHERGKSGVVANYPRGMHTTIAEGIHELLGEGAFVRTATLEQPDHV
jgi:trehalose utilization protein